MTSWKIQRHYILFTVISLLCVALLVWWVYFMVREGERMTRQQERMWRQQIEMAEAMSSVSDRSPAESRSWIEKRFPDLRIGSSGRVMVKQEARESLAREAIRHVRMFSYEGGFFILLLLSGVAYMYWTLRREIEFERRQSTFLSATSHELKTPLTSLRLFLDTLQHRKLSPEQREQALSTMGVDIERLNDLIDRLLQAQALLSGSRKASLMLVDLAEETRLAIARDRHVIDEQGFHLKMELTDSLTAMAEPERWQLVVRNLVENAVKYSADSREVSVKLEQNGPRARLSVTDHGIGLDRAECEKTFEKFYRVGNEDTRRSKGAGLGLFLVRQIAESFNGRAYAASAGPGKGSTFTVEIPLTEGKQHG